MNHEISQRIESARIAHEDSLEYYAKYKPAIGQKTLEEHWITLRGGGEGAGTHVQVDKEGNITAGPAALAAKGIKNMSDFGKKAQADPIEDRRKEHEMTRKEFVNSPKGQAWASKYISSTKSGMLDRDAEPNVVHRNAVKNALQAGEKLSPEVLADYPDLVKKPETEPAQQKSPAEMRTAHKAAMDVIDTKLAETTKRLGSEKSRLSKSRSQSAKNQIEELEEQYRTAKQDASDEKTRLSGEFIKSLESNPEFRAQKAETAVKAKAMREKEDARLVGASEQQEKDDWDRVQKSGGIDEARKSLTAEIKQLKMRQSHTKDANEWKLKSNIANREKSLEYLESLNTKFGKPEAEQHNPTKPTSDEQQSAGDLSKKAFDLTSKASANINVIGGQSDKERRFHSGYHWQAAEAHRQAKKAMSETGSKTIAEIHGRAAERHAAEHKKMMGSGS